MELITVIIPIYNVEKFLERCITSVINQTYKSIEILLINDGSPDNSDKIMEKYAKKDNRIKCFYKKNGGLSDARNYGLKHAKGKYVCFIDSDDYIDKNYVLKLYDSIKQNSSEIAWCDFNMVDDSGITGEIIQTEDDLWSFEMPSACNKLFLKSLFTKNEIYFPKGIWYEDLATTPRLFFIAKKVSRVNEKLYNYYNNNESITKTYSKKVMDIKECLLTVYDFYKENNIKKYDDIIEYIYLYSGILNTTFRASMSNEVSIKELKEYVFDVEEKFPNIYNNKIGKKRLDKTRKLLMILVKMRMFSFAKIIIRTKKKIFG